MTVQEFYNLVKLMRKAQNIYFRTKNKVNLQKAKDLETEVDNEILRYNKAYYTEKELEFL